MEVMLTYMVLQVQSCKADIMTGALCLTAQRQVAIRLVHIQIHGVNVDQADGSCRCVVYTITPEHMQQEWMSHNEQLKAS